MEGKEYSFEGIAEGEIMEVRSGEGGFGYDPVFKPQGFEKTFAELSMEEKNIISHRGIAVQALSRFLK
jgi:XTP/dITP diphosphohydrolase